MQGMTKNDREFSVLTGQATTCRLVAYGRVISSAWEYGTATWSRDAVQVLTGVHSRSSIPHLQASRLGHPSSPRRHDKCRNWIQEACVDEEVMLMNTAQTATTIRLSMPSSIEFFEQLNDRKKSKFMDRFTRTNFNDAVVGSNSAVSHIAIAHLGKTGERMSPINYYVPVTEYSCIRQRGPPVVLPRLRCRVLKAKGSSGELLQNQMKSKRISDAITTNILIAY